MEYLICLLVLFIIYFIVLRSYFTTVLDCILSRRQRRKTAHGQSVIAWLFYLRFKGMLPKKLSRLYYFGIMLGLVCIAVMAVFVSLRLNSDILLATLCGYALIMGVPLIVTELSWWDAKHRLFHPEMPTNLPDDFTMADE